MTKASGLDSHLWVLGRDLSSPTGSVESIRTSMATLPSTGIDKSAMERLPGIKDGGIDFTSFFDDAALSSHSVLAINAFTDLIEYGTTYSIGQALNSPAASVLGRQLNYDPTRPQDGSLTLGVSMPAKNMGLDWGRLITAGKRTDSTATSPATGTDFNLEGGASTAFGWQAWLHVFAFTGTSVTVTLQDSADNSAFTSLTGGAFTAVTTAPNFQALQGGRTATVRRYIRAITTGTFSNFVFGVQFTRNVTSNIL